VEYRPYRPEPADTDPVETREWVESLAGVLESGGRERARFLLGEVLKQARHADALPDGPLVTDYVNTIPVDQEPPYPGDEKMEKRIRRIVRWNAAVMVHRANQRYPGLGGHLSTYASAASLYEVGFNHFFRGKSNGTSGDQIYYQGHAAPGIYSRSYLEGILTDKELERFRRETDRGKGLPSYPHPRLMPAYWEFPTVSMGLGPLSAIYQARFNRYLLNRGLVDTSSSRVWAFLGDGECDEPEALGALHVPYREGLDNLIFVVNCNLQRLDGPVRGNGKIIQELEANFRGAGWDVIKVVWGSEWDPLFARDTTHALRRRLAALVDGDFQKYATSDGAKIRQECFGVDPALLALVEHLDDNQLRKLTRGGHDYRKIYAAYDRAVRTRGRPTCILAHTVKGWALGEGFEAKNVTHQMKKMNLEELKRFRDRLELPIPDKELEDPPFYHPGLLSEEVDYIKARREALGGHIPKRRVYPATPVELPGRELYQEFYEGTKTEDGVSTTIAFVRLLQKLIKDKDLGKFIVPIIPDEARTFGMDPFFRMVGIYANRGQLYEPVDRGLLLYYREAKDGQVLEEGITEAGAMGSFIAAATTYATHGQTMVPFYMFYSMFGFQRTGDLMWLLGDQRGRGFLLGATAGRTTLNGEGLQHEDGHSHILASTVPCVEAYDPAFAYEIAMIVQDGLRRMYGDCEDIYYYITLQNENYPMPALEGDEAEVEAGVLRGLYRFKQAESRSKDHVQLFGSGSIMNCVLEARQILADRYDVSADVWSATSYKRLREDALACERWNRLHPEAEQKTPWIVEALEGVEGPFIAATDYMKLLPDMVAPWINGRLVALGTDGFGMSDTRQALRRHFEVDAASIVIAALDALRQAGKVDGKLVAQAIADFDYDPDKLDPRKL